MGKYPHKAAYIRTSRGDRLRGRYLHKVTDILTFQLHFYIIRETQQNNFARQWSGALPLSKIPVVHLVSTKYDNAKYQLVIKYTQCNVDYDVVITSAWR